MADFEYKRDPQRFFFIGMDLNRPVDEIKPMKAALLQNVRTHQFGRLTPRYGMTQMVAIDSTVHSIRRLNDVINLDYARVVGDYQSLYIVRAVKSTSSGGGGAVRITTQASHGLTNGSTVTVYGVGGTTEANGTWTITNVNATSFDLNGTTYANAYTSGGLYSSVADTGYSGNPLAMIPYRPEESPASWMFISDSSRMRKVSIDAKVHQIGLPAPTTYPTTIVAPDAGSSAFYKAINTCNDTTNWAAGGTCSSVAASNPKRVDSSTAHIEGILYDSGSVGWCTIRYADDTNSIAIGEGMHLLIGAEEVVVQSVAGATSATTILGISYDTGSSGACSMVLETSFGGCDVDAMLYNSTKGKYCRVAAILKDVTGRYSIRTTTADAWAANDEIYGVSSFRCHTDATHAAAEALSAVGIKGTFSAAEGLGYMTFDTSSSPVDLSQVGKGVPSSESDYLHISLAVSDPSLVVEGKIMFDVGNSATFEGDYFYKSFRPSDLSPNLSLTEPVPRTTTDQAAAQREIVSSYGGSGIYGGDYSSGGGLYGSVGDANPWDNPDAAWNTAVVQRALINSGLAYPSGIGPSTTMRPSGPGWAELTFPIAEMTKVGQDVGKDLRQVYRVRIAFDVTAGAFSANVHSINLRGGHGPDVTATGTHYLYRYRARCSLTGAVSNWGPATRGGTYVRRQQIDICAPERYTGAAEADLLDFQRFGGLNLQWNYVGTVSNVDSSIATLNDRMPDDIAAAQDSVLLTNYQPWPIVGLPDSGATTEIIGTTIKGTGFHTDWAPGTIVEVLNQAYTIYRVASSSFMEINESAGVSGAVQWRVTRPTLVSQPLVCLWGPVDETLFACGDSTNPQRLYFTNPGSESTRDTNWVDITSPSEPLQNGVVYNGRNYVFSSERMFQLVPAQLPDGTSTWQATEIPNGRGLFARWGMTGLQGTTGPMICFLGKDGIYATDGGTPVSLTRDDLNPLFPHEGNPGQSVNAVLPPDMTKGNEPKLRLAFYGDYLYFDYPPVTS